MCGYCTEETALKILCDDIRGNLHMKDLGYGLARYFYLRETPDYIPAMDRLSLSLAQKRLPFFSEVPPTILLYRGLEILLEQGFESPAYQLLLKKPLYRDAIAAACSIEKRKAFDTATEGLNIEYLGLLYDTETYICSERSKQLQTLATVLPPCRNLLKHYISWWLDGHGLRKDEYCVTEEEYSRFSLLFRAVYYSILMVGSCSAGKEMIFAIAQRNPAGTPLIDADDLWLQRVAALKYYDLEGLEAFSKHLTTFRDGHFFYINHVRGLSIEQKQNLLDEVMHFQGTDHADSFYFMTRWLRKDLGLDN